jgi:CheY-like chemotaxis protein
VYNGIMHIDAQRREKKTVLFVESDPKTRQAIEGCFGDQDGITVLFARTPAEAWAVLARQKVHVVVSDLCTPVIDGLELLEHLLWRHPETARVLLGERADQARLKRACEEAQVDAVLPLPLDGRQTQETIRGLFAREAGPASR